MNNTSAIKSNNTKDDKDDKDEDITMLTNNIKEQLLCNNYKGDELTKKICKVLNLSNNIGWSIVDTCENLVMIHYNDDADMKEVGHLRGILVDTERECVLADSFGFTPTIVNDSIEFKNGNLNMIDKEGNGYIFKEDNCVINKLYEGVLIRVIWYNNNCFFLTHKKINPLRSRWGNSKSFLEMYKEANGPTAEQLFDTSKSYSNTCYYFLVVDKQLLVGTRQKVENPYIVFLLKKNLNINRDENEYNEGISSFECKEFSNSIVNESCIIRTQNITTQEANKHLKHGFYNEFKVQDIRQLTGEGVIMYSIENGHIKNMVRIHSTSYDWRINMRGNNPNINHQFYSLLNSVYADIKHNCSIDKIEQKLVLYPLFDVFSLKDFYIKNDSIINLQVLNKKYAFYKTRKERIHLLWINYVLSLPTHLQGKALNIIDEFQINKNAVIDWIISLELKHKNTSINEQVLPDRVKHIINISRKLSNDRISRGDNYSPNGKIINLPNLIKGTIRNLINKENGTSLYSMIKHMNKINQTIDNQTIDNQTIDNQTIDNQTIDNQTIENQTIENQTIENI